MFPITSKPMVPKARLANRPATPSAGPAATATPRKPSALQQGIGAVAGAGYFALVFRAIGVPLVGGAAIITVPGLIVGAVGGSRLGKWVADGLKAHVSAGAVVGGLALGALYGVGAIFLAVIGPGFALFVPGIALAALAGGAVGGALQDAVGKRLGEH